MKLKTFKGGIHPNPKKEKTKNIPVRPLSAPEDIYIPLRQHIGAECEPLVKAGDKVLMGQKIGESKSFISAPVHSSVSGEVVKIENYPHPGGGESLTVFIKNDFNDTLVDTVRPWNLDFNKQDIVNYINHLTKEEIVNKVKEAGITGMGGAAFPLHVKLSPPDGVVIDTIVVNGAECEPYLTSDHRAMLERPYASIIGALMVKKAVNAKRIIIAIENNKVDAIEIMEDCTKDFPEIEVGKLKTKYPQGSEKQLVQAVTGRQVPSGGLPSAVGIVVCNVDTCAAVSNAVVRNMPLIERNVTVSGNAVKEPKNFSVRVGTLFSELFDNCGGFNGVPQKIVMGGPMMGICQVTEKVPVIKGTSGILAFLEPPTYGKDEGACIKCGKCVEVCPMRLMPNFLTVFSVAKDTEKLMEYNINDCMECGSCAFICPQRRFIVQHIKQGKLLVKNNSKK